MVQRQHGNMKNARRFIIKKERKGGGNMLTKFEKRAMAYILALLMCASMVLMPGVAVSAKEEDSVDEVEILESADWLLLLGKGRRYDWNFRF